MPLKFNKLTSSAVPLSDQTPKVITFALYLNSLELNLCYCVGWTKYFCFLLPAGYQS